MNEQIYMKRQKALGDKSHKSKSQWPVDSRDFQPHWKSRKGHSVTRRHTLPYQLVKAEKEQKGLLVIEIQEKSSLLRCGDVTFYPPSEN